tara:strand:+ start:1135 stop:1758 length:624 start_codon:yes stop_codon:yes gene_type:complete
MTIAIINTFTSNIKSVYNSLEYLGYNDYEEISYKNLDIEKKFTHIILPGNGSFKDNMKKIKEGKLEQFIIKNFQENNFFLGICVGMQILATYGEENGITKGLNIIPGTVKKIPVKKNILPHIGWNEMIIEKQDKIFNNIKNSEQTFYFLHSYYFDLKDEAHLLATANYEIKLTACIKKNNFYGVQFHPEKSQSQGLQLIKNFLELKC